MWSDFKLVHFPNKTRSATKLKPYNSCTLKMSLDQSIYMKNPWICTTPNPFICTIIYPSILQPLDTILSALNTCLEKVVTLVAQTKDDFDSDWIFAGYWRKNKQWISDDSWEGRKMKWIIGFSEEFGLVWSGLVGWSTVRGEVTGPSTNESGVSKVDLISN